MIYDLLFKNARLFVPGRGFTREDKLAVKDGLIAAIGAAATAEASTVIDLRGDILTSGLIDLHTHIYHKANAACVDPVPVAIASGASTLIDAGTSGASSIHGFVDYICAPAPVRLLAFLNISYAGIFGFHPKIRVGEAADERLLHTDLCIEAASRFRSHVVGIKVRIGKGESGDIGSLALERALEASEELSLPLMAHIGLPPLELDTVLNRLRAGDILTHCFRGSPNSPLFDDTGQVRPSVLAARKRGVLFDIGHGLGSFSVHTARGMLDAAFLPDTISSDIHQFNIDGPVHDLLHTASKFLALGMTLENVLSALTINAAKAINRPELGRLAPGDPADLAVLAVEPVSTTFRDTSGHHFVGEEVLKARLLFVAGKLVGDRV